VPAEAQFELTTTIEFEADASYDNLDTASYDSEDKVLIPWETVERTVKYSEVVQADLTILFNTIHPHNRKSKSSIYIPQRMCRFMRKKMMGGLTNKWPNIYMAAEVKRK
jgi:hypothetical protein